MELGGKIRELRKQKKMSIDQLSKVTELSTGLISQLERNMISPNVAALWKISAALEVNMNYFFDEPEEQDPIVRKGERKKIQLPNSKITYELLCPNLKKAMEVLYITIEPGECSTEDKIAHEGEECGIVLKGSLKVKWGNKEYLLNEGDSIYLDSTTPHRYVNNGDEVSVSIWTMTPPSY